MSPAAHQLRSRCIATVNVDIGDIRADLAVIDGLVSRDTYSEFSLGRWHSHVLANATGDEEDDEFRPHAGPAVKTRLGHALPGITGLVENTFHLDRLRWLRIFTQSDGLLIPHVDYVEFSDPATEPTTRLQLPLRTSPACLHSEAETVVHLRAGEVWFLDATVPHAAYTPAGLSRVALCLDFAVSSRDIATCLRAPAAQGKPPMTVERAPLEEQELAALIALGAVLDRNTIRDVLRLLGTMHFRRHAHAAACFDWLVAAAKRSKDKGMRRKAEDFRDYCLYRRAYHERFAWLC